MSKIQSFEQKTKTYILDFVPSSGNAHLFKPNDEVEYYFEAGNYVFTPYISTRTHFLAKRAS